MSVESGDVAVGVGTVVEGRDLRETQSAPVSDIVYRPAPHYPLGQAEFNLLVDPPPRTHAFLPAVFGLWLGSVVNAGSPLLQAFIVGTPVTIASVPSAARYAFIIASVLFGGLAFAVWRRPNRRDNLVKRIAKVYEK